MGNAESTTTPNASSAAENGVASPRLKRSNTIEGVGINSTRKKSQQADGRRRRRTTMRKTTSMQVTGNSSFGSGGRIIGGLGDQDLDDIYNFVQHMKGTNIGESMLSDLVVKQARDADSDFASDLSSSQENNNVPPLPVIGVVEKPRSSERRKRSSTPLPALC